jgi:hypothetical protein
VLDALHPDPRDDDPSHVERLPLERSSAGGGGNCDFNRTDDCTSDAERANAVALDASEYNRAS